MSIQTLPCRCGCGELSPVAKRIRIDRGKPPNGATYIPGHQKARIDPGRPEKKCSKCKVVKPRSEFNGNRATKDGLTNYCKLCNTAHTSKWAREVGRFKKYGLTPEDYREMWEKQEGICAICLTRPVAHIDHDHETGIVRGLLCGECNRGLGKFKDNPAWLERAAVYVKNYTT